MIEAWQSVIAGIGGMLLAAIFWLCIWPSLPQNDVFTFVTVAAILVFGIGGVIFLIKGISLLLKK